MYIFVREISSEIYLKVRFLAKNCIFLRNRQKKKKYLKNALHNYFSSYGNFHKTLQNCEGGTILKGNLRGYLFLTSNSVASAFKEKLKMMITPNL